MRDLVLMILLTLTGYLAGSVLFAKIFVRAFGRGDVEAESDDGNPGTANAYMNGGFWCGTLVLLCDLGKGILPVAAFIHLVDEPGWMIIPVMLAPVIGHAFSVFDNFHGGKCIAVSFGVLLGLYPDLLPALILAFFYILFSAVRIKPHSRRTLIAYLCTSIASVFLVKQRAVVAAVWLISMVVQRKHVLKSL